MLNEKSPLGIKADASAWKACNFFRLPEKMTVHILFSFKDHTVSAGI
jgi:hypothetical protein